MSPALVIAFALTVLIAAYLAFKLVADKTKVVTLRDERDAARREAQSARERQKDLEAKLASRSQEASGAKDATKKATDAADAKREAEAAKRRVEAELKDANEQIRGLTADVNRVRQEKEQQRQELEKLRERLATLGDADRRLESLSGRLETAEREARQARAEAEAARALVPPEPDPADPAREERLVVKLSRELEQLKKATDRTDSAIERWKNKALESEFNYRRTQKKYQDAQSILNITQANLDLTLDELHLLKHGEEPELPRAGKAAKRAALKPKEQAVEVRRDQVIDRTHVGDAASSEDVAPEAEVEPKLALAKSALPSPSTDSLKAAPEEGAAAAPSDAPAAPEAEATTEVARVSTAAVKRTRKPEGEGEALTSDANRPKAPPRPKK
jgi:chromosome segregation ATPase